MSVRLPATVLVVVAMLLDPLALWQEPPEDAAQVQVQPESVAGKVSATETFDTAAVAGLVTVIGYVVLLPGVMGVTPSVLLIDRSARGTMVSVSMAELLALLVSLA